MSVVNILTEPFYALYLMIQRDFTIENDRVYCNYDQYYDLNQFREKISELEYQLTQMKNDENKQDIIESIHILNQIIQKIQDKE